MCDYFALNDSTLKLYKTVCSLGGHDAQLYLYVGDCRWEKAAEQNRIMPALCRIGNEEAQSILEEIEEDNYVLLDGQVYVYD